MTLDLLSSDKMCKKLAWAYKVRHTRFPTIFMFCQDGAKTNEASILANVNKTEEEENELIRNHVYDVVIALLSETSTNACGHKLLGWTVYGHQSLPNWTEHDSTTFNPAEQILKQTTLFISATSIPSSQWEIVCSKNRMQLNRQTMGRFPVDTAMAYQWSQIIFRSQNFEGKGKNKKMKTSCNLQECSIFTSISDLIFSFQYR